MYIKIENLALNSQERSLRNNLELYVDDRIYIAYMYVYVKIIKIICFVVK